MVSVELSTREGDGQIVVVLRGQLDVAEAAKVPASLAVVAASGRTVIVDLEGLEFIDSSGLAALVRARRHARRAGFDLLLAAPQQQVVRMLAITRLIDVFAVRARVDDAVGIAGRVPVAAPAAGSPGLPAMTSKHLASCSPQAARPDSAPRTPAPPSITTAPLGSAANGSRRLGPGPALRKGRESV